MNLKWICFVLILRSFVVNVLILLSSFLVSCLCSLSCLKSKRCCSVLPRVFNVRVPWPPSDNSSKTPGVHKKRWSFSLFFDSRSVWNTVGRNGDSSHCDPLDEDPWVTGRNPPTSHWCDKLIVVSLCPAVRRLVTCVESDCSCSQHDGKMPVTAWLLY